MINHPLRIGIIGGGQLGKMLTFAAKKLGFTVYVLDPTPQGPAGQVADKQIVGDFQDEEKIKELARISDLLTFEIELANDKVLNQLIQEGKQVSPSPETLGIIRDKLKQKEFLKQNNIPTADFFEISSEEDIKKAAKYFGYPLLLKARMGGYDGRGNFVVKKEAEIKKGLEKLKGRALYVERFVRFKKELAVMVARSVKGEIRAHPVVQTIHKDNICDLVLAPAPVSRKIRAKAQELAERTMECLKGAGIFGLEMFLEKDKVLINEIAPRVHNSGHYSIEATHTSQFEQHIRAITGLPLGETAMITKAAVMKNILGTATGNGFPKGIEKALKIPGVSLHIYGKSESRPGRKMGHITVVGNSLKECLQKANKARKMLKI